MWSTPAAWEAKRHESKALILDVNFEAHLIVTVQDSPRTVIAAAHAVRRGGYSRFIVNVRASDAATALD